MADLYKRGRIFKSEDTQGARALSKATRITEKTLPLAPNTTRHTMDYDSDGSIELPTTTDEHFCLLYTGECRGNASEAIVKANCTSSSNREAIKKAATRILARTEVLARIQYLNDNALSEARMNLRQSMYRLSIIAQARITDFLDEDGNIDMGMVRASKYSAAIQEIIVETLPSGSRRVRLKMKDDMRALTLAGLTAESVHEAPQNNLFIIET